MNNWQVIETGPKDGTRVLVADDDGTLYVGWWSGHGWVHDGDDYDIVLTPTHWQPLPMAPNLNHT